MRTIPRTSVVRLLLFFTFGLPALCSAQGLPNITTHHYDNMRTGWNWKETTLTSSSVNSTSFFLRAFAHNSSGYSYLDQQIDAQPLALNYPYQTLSSTDPVVYVATENNTVYAIDGSSGLILVQRSMPEPAVPIGSVGPISGCNNNSSLIGINSTPVIDESRGILYVVTATLGTGTIIHKLHALNVNTLADVSGSPLVISPPPGYIYNRQRSALTLFNGGVLIPFASFCDTSNVPQALGHLVYANLSNGSWSQVAFETTSLSWGGKTQLASIWMSGSGPATTGNTIYFATGNGMGPYAPGVFGGIPNLPESLVELTGSLGPPITLNLVSWFTPPQYMMWDDNDTDFGAGGVLLVPSGAPASITPSTPAEFVTAGGKSGDLYVNVPGSLSDNSNPFQALAGIGGGGGCWCGTTYFTGSDGKGYVVSSFGSKLSLYSVSASGLTLVRSINAPSSFYGDGGFFTTVSSNQTASGSQVLWAVIRPDSNFQLWLYAYNALTLAQLYSAPIGFWGNAGANANVVPVVANGQVYVANNDQLAIFGTTGTPLPPAPVSIGADFNTDCPMALVSWPASPGATSYQLYDQAGSLAWNWSFPPGTPVYSGAALQTDVGVRTGETFLFRVAACNQSGCSPLSAAMARGSRPSQCP